MLKKCLYKCTTDFADDWTIIWKIYKKRESKSEYLGELGEIFKKIIIIFKWCGIQEIKKRFFCGKMLSILDSCQTLVHVLILVVPFDQNVPTPSKWSRNKTHGTQLSELVSFFFFFLGGGGNIEWLCDLPAFETVTVLDGLTGMDGWCNMLILTVCVIFFFALSNVLL